MITLVFGDSISWGAFDLKQGGWVEMLKKAEMPKDGFVYNCSISGNSSTDILSRMQDEIDYRLDPQDDLRIILAFGINDAARKGSDKRKALATDSYLFIDNVDKIIKMALRYTDDVVVIGATKVDENKSTPVHWDENLYYYNKDIIYGNESLRQMCDSFRGKVKFIDVFDVLAKNNLTDGTHPTPEGHLKLYKKIIKEL